MDLFTCWVQRLSSVQSQSLDQFLSLRRYPLITLKETQLLVYLEHVESACSTKCRTNSVVGCFETQVVGPGSDGPLQRTKRARIKKAH